MLIDSHCHLDHLHIPDYGQALDAVLDEARRQGVSGFLCIGIDYDRFDLLLDIQARHDDVWLTLGEHPLSDNLAQHKGELLAQLAGHAAVVGVGETGLDYHYAPDTAAAQRESFVHHLEVAAQLQKPVVVHSREAEQDTLELIAAHQGPAAGVLHCFTGSWDMAKRAMDMNFYISLSGILTFRNAEDLRDIARKLPLDRLLLETDSPWLAPGPYRGKPNQPAYLPQVAKVVAEVRGMTMADLGAATSENFFRLFRHAAGPAHTLSPKQLEVR